MQKRPKATLSLGEQAPSPSPSFKASLPAVSSWSKPVLSVYGDVRQLTMGTSPGMGESAQPNNFRT
jgi:hypothetical protein